MIIISNVIDFKSVKEHTNKAKDNSLTKEESREFSEYIDVIGKLAKSALEELELDNKLNETETSIFINAYITGFLDCAGLGSNAISQLNDKQRQVFKNNIYI